MRASERTPRSKTISSPSIRRTSSIPANASETNKPDPCRRSANTDTEAVANAIPIDRDMATELFPKETENDHRAY